MQDARRGGWRLFLTRQDVVSEGSGCVRTEDAQPHSEAASGPCYPGLCTCCRPDPGLRRELFAALVPGEGA